MRALAMLFVFTMVAGTASVGPATPDRAAAAAEVAPRVEQIPLSGADLRPAPRTAGGDPETAPDLIGPEREVAPFSLVALTWPAGATLPEVSVRTRGEGRWRAWTPLHADSDGPDAAESEASDRATDGQRESTVALWAGPSDAVQVRAAGTRGNTAPALPADLRLVLVDPGSAPVDAGAGFAQAAKASAPKINSRAAWGANERLREQPVYTGHVRAAFVHHTGETNAYERGDVPRIIRAIYVFHTQVRGWSDIGYNFLVDHWGRVWEGRAGGVRLPVQGAHTGGFNVDSFGVAAMGHFGKRRPSVAMLESIARTIAWKFDLGWDDLDPHATTRLVSNGGGTSRYPAGKEVAMRRISGHRDASRTTCPGEFLYASLPSLRTRVGALQDSGDVEFGGGRGGAAVAGPPAARRLSPPGAGG